ncbi:hypothetical protein BT69DRAFT_1315479 [Atractiella rhizophila]|nr:hypothetical protein BT69DRAFT_1315479 [Atractiella rhizophila]
MSPTRRRRAKSSYRQLRGMILIGKFWNGDQEISSHTPKERFETTAPHLFDVSEAILRQVLSLSGRCRRAACEESHQRAQGGLNHNLFDDDSARRLVVLEQQVHRLREEQARLTHLLAIVHKAANTPVIQGVGIPVHLITRQYRLVASAGSLGFLPSQIMVPRRWGSSTVHYFRLAPFA